MLELCRNQLSTLHSQNNYFFSLSTYFISFLQAHRVVLAACSDYFRAMFTDPMRERTQEEIHLSGVQAQGLELVLDYIYTSKLSLTLANIQTVLDTATHLQVLQVSRSHKCI